MTILACLFAPARNLGPSKPHHHHEGIAWHPPPMVKAQDAVRRTLGRELARVAAIRDGGKRPALGKRRRNIETIGRRIAGECDAVIAKKIDRGVLPKANFLVKSGQKLRLKRKGDCSGEAAILRFQTAGSGNDDAFRECSENGLTDVKPEIGIVLKREEEVPLRKVDRAPVVIDRGCGDFSLAVQDGDVHRWRGEIGRVGSPVFESHRAPVSIRRFNLSLALDMALSIPRICSSKLAERLAASMRARSSAALRCSTTASPTRTHTVTIIAALNAAIRRLNIRPA